MDNYASPVRTLPSLEEMLNWKMPEWLEKAVAEFEDEDE